MPFSATDEREAVERVTTPNGELQLSRMEAAGETHYELIMNGVFLMASYNAPSCVVLTDTVMAGIEQKGHIDLLIGGLGMGFALRRALEYSSLGTVRVVELEPKIVEWNRVYLGNQDILDDSRTEVVLGDFHDYVHGNARSYHGIAMDIDNGPDWIVRPENKRAYSLSTLQVLRSRLRPGGVLAIWGHAEYANYERALERVFGDVTTHHATDHEPTGKPLSCVVYAVKS
jgi:spermidine synthase